jgi:hypothetical protein
MQIIEELKATEARVRREEEEIARKAAEEKRMREAERKRKAEEERLRREAENERKKTAKRAREEAAGNTTTEGVCVIDPACPRCEKNKKACKWDGIGKTCLSCRQAHEKCEGDLVGGRERAGTKKRKVDKGKGKARNEEDGDGDGEAGTSGGKKASSKRGGYEGPEQGDVRGVVQEVVQDAALWVMGPMEKLEQRMGEIEGSAREVGGRLEGLEEAIKDIAGSVIRMQRMTTQMYAYLHRKEQQEMAEERDRERESKKEKEEMGKVEGGAEVQEEGDEAE